VAVAVEQNRQEQLVMVELVAVVKEEKDQQVLE
jgi:hypothetical protein